MAIDLADGRPWVLLPGTLCTHFVFDGLLRALGVPDSARRPIVLREGVVENYLPLLEEVCTPGAVVCGFSLGAIVAAHLADRLPACEFLFFGLNPHADATEKRAGRLEFAQDVAQSGGRSALTDRLPELWGKDPEKARHAILEMAAETASLMPAQTQLALTRPGAIKKLAQVQVPVSLLTGSKDTWAPVSLARDAAQAAPAGYFIPLSGLGHYALIEDPALCAAAVSKRFDRK